MDTTGNSLASAEDPPQSDGENHQDAERLLHAGEDAFPLLPHSKLLPQPVGRCMALAPLAAVMFDPVAVDFAAVHQDLHQKRVRMPVCPFPVPEEETASAAHAVVAAEAASEEHVGQFQDKTVQHPDSA